MLATDGRELSTKDTYTPSDKSGKMLLRPATSDAVGALDVIVQTWLSREFAQRPGLGSLSISVRTSYGRRSAFVRKIVIFSFFVSDLFNVTRQLVCYYKLHIVLNDSTSRFLELIIVRCRECNPQCKGRGGGRGSGGGRGGPTPLVVFPPLVS